MIPLNLTEIDGNLLDHVNDGFIAHQCNCVSAGVGGLAFAIYKEYPEAHIRKGYEPERFGSCDIVGSVINMYSQKYSGGPNESDDSYDVRLTAFDCAWDCVIAKLMQMNIQDKIKIHFPARFGSDLAAGKWEDYRNKIIQLAINYPNMDFCIVNRNF